MELSCDVLVIGGGAAGVAAALAASSRGRRTLVVRRSPGATALAAGAWHGPLPDPIRDALARAGLEHVAASAPLPHPAGRIERARYAAASQAAAALDGDAVVCGIAGLPGFNARALARLWAHDSGLRFDAATLQLPGTPPAGWAPASLAAALERDVAPLGDRLADALRRSGRRRAILPAVLGLERAPEVLRTVRDAAGAEVGEALGVPPSIPGWRLDRALVRALAAAGVELLEGEAHAEGRAYVVATAAGERRVAARAVVLATGKFTGGGVRAEPALVEGVLGLPVVVEALGREFTSADVLTTVPERALPQPILGAGVRVDAGGRVAIDGHVWAAGAVRAAIETASLGLGDAAEQGWHAGLAAAEAA